MYRRNIKPLLEKAITRSPVILITGARQTGKSTLVKEIAQEKNYKYVSFDNLQTLQAAKTDPIAFISNSPKPLILDEVQRVPEIFLTIKEDVDNNRIPGRYILTGSANPFLIPNLGDSLTGRIEIINSMTLSQGELSGVTEDFITTVFNNQLPPEPQKITKEELYKKILTGGFPSMQQKNEEDQEHWMENYIDTLLQKDVKDLAHVEDITRLPNLLRYLATMAGCLVNVSEISRKSQIPSTTLHRYLTLFQTLFILNIEPSWSPNLGMRFVKSPKLYLLDSGLLAYLLGIDLERALTNPILMGPVIENFIVSELLKQATWNKTKVRIHHYRTPAGQEVDIILEDRAGNIVGIEIKSAEMVRATDFNGLKFLQEKVKDKFIKGIVLYQGSEYTPFGEKLIALPIHSLWSST